MVLVGAPAVLYDGGAPSVFGTQRLVVVDVNVEEDVALGIVGNHLGAFVEKGLAALPQSLAVTTRVWLIPSLLRWSTALTARKGSPPRPSKPVFSTSAGSSLRCPQCLDVSCGEYRAMLGALLASADVQLAV